MENHSEPLRGIHATLAAVGAMEDPRPALPLLGAALAEDAPVRRAVLKFLLSKPGMESAILVVRGFSNLKAEERAEALREESRLVTAAEVVLGDQEREGRLGLADFASALPAPDGMRFILHLIDDPIQAVQLTARNALIRTAREYMSGRWRLSSQADLRRLTTACDIALRSASREEAAPLVSTLFQVALESSEARSVLWTTAAMGPEEARRAVREGLASSSSPVAASILCELLSSGSSGSSQWILSILRMRREPEFLMALAREAATRMQSPSGIPVSAVTALSQVAWEALPTKELEALPSLWQKKLLTITRAFPGDLTARARRIAVFLKSRNRRIRELTLDILREYPPATYKEELPALLDDPAEELQLRAAELLVRIGTADCRRKLLEKTRRASERVRRFILGRLVSAGYPKAASAPVPPKRAKRPSFEEYVFPVVRPFLLARTGKKS